MTLKLTTILIAVAVSVTAIAAVVTWIRRDATNDALQGVRENNEAIGTTAEEGALDYGACRARGLHWNWDRNRCQR